MKNPRSPESLKAKVERATQLQRQGKLGDAVTLCRQVLRSSPKHYDAQLLMGVIAYQKQQLERADHYFFEALAIRPQAPRALHNRSIILRKLGRIPEALDLSDKLLDLSPDFAAGLISRGDILRELNRYEEALACYDQALALDPQSAYALLHRGTSLRALHQHEEALACFDKALELGSALQSALLVNKGFTLTELERFDDAIAACEAALEIAPDYAYGHFTLSIPYLFRGDYENGFREYEWRPSKLRIDDSRRFKCPQWTGATPVDGKTILLHADQGLGDTIQFCRYADEVASRGGRVILEVQRPLKILLTGLKGVDTLIASGEKPPNFDLHCPLMSLPGAVGTRIDTIPASPQYLNATGERIDHWSQKLGQQKKMRVGLVWSGSAGQANDHNRSISLSRFAQLMTADADYISLQKELRPDDAATLTTLSNLRHFGDELVDFSDTAALATLMDVIISVDTSVVHLAGALGRPTWLLLAKVTDWRWMVDRDDSPWYPTMRLFRQPEAGNWDAALKAAGEQLKSLSTVHRGP